MEWRLARISASQPCFKSCRANSIRRTRRWWRCAASRARPASPSASARQRSDAQLRFVFRYVLEKLYNHFIHNRTCQSVEWSRRHCYYSLNGNVNSWKHAIYMIFLFCVWFLLGKRSIACFEWTVIFYLSVCPQAWDYEKWSALPFLCFWESSHEMFVCHTSTVEHVP